jgi:ubiquinone/menaquinone biosynthesis C-methylase UbiE
LLAEKKDFLEHYEVQGKNAAIGTSYRSPKAGVRYMFQKRLSTILGLFHEVNGKLVLDIGCGSGAYAYYLSKNGASVCALDFSHNYLLNAKTAIKNRAVQFLQADAEHLPFKDKVFDWILCTEVIEHIISPELLLTETGRLLKDEGTLVVSIPSKYSPTEIFRKLISGSHYEHLHFWTKKEFKRTLIAKGIKVTESKHCLFFSYFLRDFLSRHISLISLVDVMEDAFSTLPFVKNFAWCMAFKCVKSG